jgi:hypothetical protein
MEESWKVLLISAAEKSRNVYYATVYSYTWLVERRTDALLVRVCKRLQQENLRLCFYFHVATGQKPANAKRTVH